MMLIAPCCIIRLKSAVVLLVPADDYKRIEIESRTLLSINTVVSVCIERRS